jgi:hypothetical protein
VVSFGSTWGSSSSCSNFNTHSASTTNYDEDFTLSTLWRTVRPRDQSRTTLHALHAIRSPRSPRSNALVLNLVSGDRLTGTAGSLVLVTAGDDYLHAFTKQRGELTYAAGPGGARPNPAAAAAARHPPRAADGTPRDHLDRAGAATAALDATGDSGVPARARSYYRFAPPRINFIPDPLREPVPLFLKRRCGRTLGPARATARRSRASASASRRAARRSAWGASRTRRRRAAGIILS